MSNQNVSRYLRDGMTVAELIEELKLMDPCARVVFAYASNDYWRTQVARVVKTVDEATLGWSEYHRVPTPVDPDRDTEASTDVFDAVVLNLDDEGASQ
jgi:hypothetical protein